MLQKSYRLHRSIDFHRVKKYGSRGKTSFFWVNWQSNHLENFRFGFIVTKKIGNAVQRHRCVRVLRESVRYWLPYLEGHNDIVLVVRPALLGKKTEQVQKVLGDFFGRQGWLKLQQV